MAAFVVALLFALPAAGSLNAERESVSPSTLRSTEADPQRRAIESPVIASDSPVVPDPVKRDVSVARDVARSGPAEAVVAHARRAPHRKIVVAAREDARTRRAPVGPSEDVSNAAVPPVVASQVAAWHPQMGAGVKARIGPR